MQPEIEIILGNSNKRFSGVTSTMLQVLPYQQQQLSIAVLGKHHLSQGIPFLNYWSFIKLTRKPLNSGKVRIFHARRNNEMIQALIAKWFFRSKIRILFTSTAQRQHSQFTQWLMRQMDSVISTCSAAANYISAVNVDAIIPHGIDLTKFQLSISKAQAKRQLGWENKLCIGSFGRIRTSKGTDILIDAVMPVLKKYPNTIVIICGECIASDQQYLQQLKNTVHTNNLSSQVIFLGKQPFDQLPLFFNAMDIVTALSRNEGYGLTPLEAMASKAAVITSRAGAWEDIIDDGNNGFIVNIDDVAATKNHLEHLCNDETLRLKLANNGYQDALRHYDVSVEAQSLCNHYKKLQ